MTNLPLMGQNAKTASHILATLTTDKKNEALLAIADEIEAQATPPFWQPTPSTSKKPKAKGLSDYLVDRLLLNESRVAALAADTRKVVSLARPGGQ